jgi:hypothetical protein
MPVDMSIEMCRHLAHASSHMLHQIASILSYEFGPSHPFTDEANNILRAIDELTSAIDIEVGVMNNDE